jgi:hypothetical protein
LYHQLGLRTIKRKKIVFALIEKDPHPLAWQGKQRISFTCQTSWQGSFVLERNELASGLIHPPDKLAGVFIFGAEQAGLRSDTIPQK